MDRRQFLVLTGRGVAATTLAAWFVSGCRRGIDLRDPRVGGPVSPSDSGRPLLALLVPDPGAGYERGSLVGGVLNHGGDGVLADLAGVDLVCVTPDRLPPEVRPSGEPLPWFVLLTREGGAVRAREFRPDLPPETPGAPPWGDSQGLNAAASARVASLAEQLHAFLLPVVGDPGQDRRARAEAARKRYVTAPPPGAHWAVSTGCGAEVEGVPAPELMPACGMGMIPEVSKRFLHFYVKS